MSKKKYYKFEVLTPNGVVFSENVIHLRAPGRDGLFGVLLHHLPSVVLLKAGVVEVQAISGNKKISISGGLADIRDYYVQIVTESAELL